MILFVVIKGLDETLNKHCLKVQNVHIHHIGHMCQVLCSVHLSVSLSVGQKY